MLSIVTPTNSAPPSARPSAPPRRAAMSRPAPPEPSAVRNPWVWASPAWCASSVARALLVSCLAVALVGLPSRARAQDTAGIGSVYGAVIDAAGAPARDVGVCVVDTGRCATSDAQGEFRIAEVRAGVYAIEIAAPGLPTFVSGAVEVRAGLDAQVQVTLPALDQLTETVSVSAPVFTAPSEIKTSGFVIEQREVAKTAGALQDVSRYLQSLPGVVIGSNDFRNDLIVRGGSPLENLFIVDNVEVPNINSFANFAAAGGTNSLLDAELIRDITFLTGGYPAPYVNRLSSVLQLSLREGNRERFEGRATVGFAGAGTILEGPLGRSRRGSWIVSVRRSFLDFFADDLGFGGVPVAYTYNGKATYDLSARDRLWVVNLSGNDSIRLGPTEGNASSDEINTLDIRYQGWRSATGLNWQRLIGTRTVGLLGVTHSEARVTQRVKDLVRFGTTGDSIEELIARSPTVYREDSAEGETTIKYDLTTTVPTIGKLQVGGTLKLFRIDYDTAQPLGDDSPFSPAGGVNAFALRRDDLATQAGAYVQASSSMGRRTSVTWGARIDRYGALGATRVSPRFGVSYTINDRWSGKAALGLYYQQPLFLLLSAFPDNRDLAPTRASHVVTGLSYTPSATFRMTLEAYQKDYRDYPVARDFPGYSLANAGDTFAVPELLLPLVSEGEGRSRGIEWFAEKRFTDRWFGQANLGVFRTRHAGRDGVRRPGTFDSPVVFNAVGGYRFTPRWEASVRVVSLSGRPYTPFDDTLSAAARRGVFDLTRVNGERAPNYFRLDARVDRTFFARGKPFLVFIGVQNLTNRRNVGQATWNRQLNQAEFNEQLGAFPLVGIDWRF